MSYWKAYATARDVPEADLRTRLIEALETLHNLAGALDVDVDNTGRALGFPQDKLFEAACALSDDVKNAREEAEKADEERRHAEDNLAKYMRVGLGGQSEKIVEALRVELETAKKDAARDREERDDAETRLASVNHLVDSYSDLLAMARKFSTAGENAGLPTKHVRRAVSRKSK
jgi:hypothetical protein